MLKHYIFILLPVILLNNSSNSTDFYKGIEHLSNLQNSKNFISKNQYFYYNYYYNNYNHTDYNTYQYAKYTIFNYLFPKNTSINKIPMIVISSIRQKSTETQLNANKIPMIVISSIHQKSKKTQLDVNKIHNFKINSNIKTLSKLPNRNTNLNNTNGKLNNKQNNNDFLCNIIQDQIDNLKNNYIKKTIKQNKNNIQIKNEELNKNSITEMYTNSVLNNTNQDKQNKPTITDITNNINNNKETVHKEYKQIEEQNTKYNDSINSIKLTFDNNNIETNTSTEGSKHDDNSTEGSKHDYTSEDDNKNEDDMKQNSEQNSEYDVKQYESNSNNIEINTSIEEDTITNNNKDEEDTIIDNNKDTENNSNDMEIYSKNKNHIKKNIKKEMKLIQLNNKRKRKNKMKLNNNKKQEQTEGISVTKQNDLNNQENIVIKEITEEQSNEINIQNNNQIHDNKTLNNEIEQINKNIIIEDNKDKIKNDEINNNIIVEEKIDDKIVDKKEENNEELKTHKKKKHKNKGRYKYNKSLIDNKQEDKKEDKKENKKEKKLANKKTKENSLDLNKCVSYSYKTFNINKEITEQIEEIDAQIKDFNLKTAALHLTRHGDNFGYEFSNIMYINMNKRNAQILNKIIEYYNMVLRGKKFNEFDTIDKLIISLSKAVIDTQILNTKQCENKDNDIIFIQIMNNNNIGIDINNINTNELRKWIQNNTTSNSSKDIDLNLFSKFTICKIEYTLNKNIDDYQRDVYQKINDYFNPIMLYIQKYKSISEHLYLKQKQLNSDLLLDEDREYLIKEYSKYLLPKIIMFYSNNNSPVIQLLENLLVDIIFYTNSTNTITELNKIMTDNITNFMSDCCNNKYIDYLREIKANEISQVEVDKLFNVIKNKQMTKLEIIGKILDFLYLNAMDIHFKEMPDISGIPGIPIPSNDEINKMKNCIIM